MEIREVDLSGCYYRIIALMDGMGKHGEFIGDLTMTQFILEINLGNDAMQTSDDIGEMLIHYGKKIRATGKYDIGTMHDQNGNTVGQYYTEG
jgi:hypothetical protein